eukprot:gene13040-15404_t
MSDDGDDGESMETGSQLHDEAGTQLDATDSDSAGFSPESLNELFNNATEEGRPYVGGFDGSIGVNQNSIKVGSRIDTPFRHRDGQTRTIAQVTERVHALFPERDPLSGVRFDTCAVVGSAGLLLIK